MAEKLQNESDEVAGPLEKQQNEPDEVTGPLEKIKVGIQKVSAWKSEMEREEEAAVAHINTRYTSLISTLEQRRDKLIGNTKKKYCLAVHEADQQISELESCLSSYLELSEQQMVDVKDVSSVSLQSFERKLTDWKQKLKDSEQRIESCSKEFSFNYNLCRTTLDRHEIVCLLENIGATNVDIGCTVKEHVLPGVSAHTLLIDMCTDVTTGTYFFMKQDPGQYVEISICSFDMQKISVLNVFQIDRAFSGSFWQLGKKRPSPHSIALNSRHLFVSFPNENVLVILTRTGEFVETMTMDKCKNPLSLSQVKGLATDEEDYILICDSGNDRMLILKPDLKTTFPITHSRNSLPYLCCPEKVSSAGHQRMVVLHKGYPPLHVYNFHGEVIALFGGLGSGMDRFIPQNLSWIRPIQGAPELFICVGDYGPLPDYVIGFDLTNGVVYHFGSVDPDRIEGTSIPPGLAADQNGLIQLVIPDRNILYAIRNSSEYFKCEN